MEVLMAERANLVFHNKAIDGTAMKRLISRLIEHFGMAYTSHILDQVKTLGFQQATATSISLGIDDLLTIPSKGWLVQDAEQQSLILEKHHHYGNVHAVEKLRQSIEIWYATSEYLRQEMNPNFRMTDPFNPVHIMSFSGARGNASQVHQLVGMRGLMSDPQGQMIDLPIQSNLREGLSLTEYIISCYGARKGVVDTAVRTSDAGYLTRRLVEVVQHIVVRRTDCGTARGISVSPRNGMMPERIFSQTLIGRVLADDIYMGPRCIATRNQDIGIGLVNRFITFRAQPISIRTPFTCRSTSWICRLCYGRSPTHGDLVELGEAVGIIAGQSIGEPGTQLTLRTFHTGGVFTGGTAEHVRAPSNGKIKFNEDLVHPTRTRHGHPAFLCSIDLYVTIESEDIVHNVNIPPKSLLLFQNDQYVESEQVIAEIRAGTSTLNFKENKCIGVPMSIMHPNLHTKMFIYYQKQVIYGKRRHTSNLSVTNDRARQKLFSSDFYGKKEDRIPDYSDLNQIICTEFDLLSKRQRNKFIIPLHSIQELENELMPYSGILIEIPVNGIFRRNSILSYFDDPQYRRKSLGIIKYGTIETHSVIKKEDLIEYRGVKEFMSKYQMKVHILPGSSSIMVRNNSIIGVDAQITLNLRSRVDIHFPGEIDKISRDTGVLIPPGTGRNSRESKKKRFFVLVRLVVTYEIDGINLATLFPPDRLQERDNVQLRIVNYILYGNGKPIRGISTQVFNYSSCEEARASFVEIRTNGLIRHFLRINLVKSPFRISEKGMIRRGTIHTLLNRNKESQSLLILSAANCSRMGPFKDIKYHRICLTIENFYSSYHLITHNQILVTNYLQLDNLKQTFQVYRSQGVHIHNRHIEIIIRQITSKVLVSEDGMSNVFSPGKLIGLASLNTQSFISVASFQETARVLAQTALRGSIDWLKGLKENVVLGVIPVGTGFKGLGEIRDILFHHRKLFDSCLSKKFHDIPKQ
ncbi:unnamed protein product [Withania somnifera]